jgi:hypothetical protein
MEKEVGRSPSGRAADTYQIGNALFNYLHAFLNSAGVESGDRQIKLTITFPDARSRYALVTKLKHDAPLVGEYSRASAAQCGNHGGYWQGIEYEFVTKAESDRLTPGLAAAETPKHPHDQNTRGASNE